MNIPGRGRGRRSGAGVPDPRSAERAAVEAVIRGLLGRDPDPVVDAGVLGLAAAGLLDEAVAGIVAGEEYRARAMSARGPIRPSALDDALVVGAHRVLLRRDPDDDERQTWVNRLQAGGGVDEMLAGLLGTEEFLIRHEELRRRARLDGDDRERMAMTRRLATLEDRVEALIRAEEGRGGLGVPGRPGR